MDVVPSFRHGFPIEPERLLGSRRVDRERGERVGQLVARNAALKLERADVVLVEPLRELLQNRILRIGGDALDYQLLARDAE